MLIEALRTFSFVTALFIHNPDPEGGIKVYTEVNSYASMEDCQKQRANATTSIIEMKKNGVLAYFVDECSSSAPILLGDKEALNAVVK